MLKYDIIPQGCLEWKCSYCTAPITFQDIELTHETSIEGTQLLLDSPDSMKHKVVFIAGFLTHKHLEPGESEDISSEFLQEHDRSGLRVPTLDTTCFVHMGINLIGKLPEPKIDVKVYCMHNENSDICG